MAEKKSTSFYGSIEGTNNLASDLSSFTTINERSSLNNKSFTNIEKKKRRCLFGNAWGALLTASLFFLMVTFFIVKSTNFQSKIDNDDVSSTNILMVENDVTPIESTSQLGTADDISTKEDLLTGVIVEDPTTSSYNSGMIEITLQPNEKIISDSDTLLYMSDNIQHSFEHRGHTLRRLFYGAKITVDVYKNIGTETGKIGLATEFPGRIISIQLEDYDDNTILGHEYSFLAAPYNVTLDFEQQRLKGPSNMNTNKLGNIFGYLLRLEKMSGNGTVFLSGSGNIIAKELDEGEKLKLIDGAWVAMTNRMKMEYSKGKRNSIFSLPLLEVEGPGTIWIDTAPIDRIVDLIHRIAPKKGNGGD